MTKGDLLYQLNLVDEQLDILDNYGQGLDNSEWVEYAEKYMKKRTELVEMLEEME
jgi:hypothetical protein